MEKRESYFITIVSGLPRSGTSLMMQMLAAGGLPPLTDEVRVPNESNPRGYFEYEAVKQLRQERGWLPAARGRAVKIIHLLLPELPNDGTFSFRVILMQRAIAEVISSQRQMLVREGRAAASIPDEQLARIYGSQLEKTEKWLAGALGFQVLRVNHRALLTDPGTVAAEVNRFLGGALDPAAMARVVDPSLYRERQ